MSDDEERVYSESEAMMVDEDEETALEIAALQQADLLPQPKKTFANRKDALAALVDEISQSGLEWIQRCDITSAAPIVVDSIENDLERELKFYEQGLEAAIQAKRLVQKAGVPFARPDDYFAEMVKTDAHMARIRQKLLSEQKGIENAEEAKKQRELRKYGKKIQQEKLKEREDQKKAVLDKVATIKKRLRSGDMGEADDFEVDIDSDDGDASIKPARGKKTKGGKPTPGSKRQRKNEKFGFGGKKRGMKNNTAESSADMSGFSVRKNKSPSFGGVGRRKPATRPGKSRRQRGH
ncbi:RRNA processing protein [Coemansia javaensis]|uniref:rRNA processing protein n=1 Tax=Coemansia javaensis TaxID=2761396 RepID=A0A9W8HD34_9FUNG|nr:RRNA processing protein [Coemansia javaensis]